MKYRQHGYRDSDQEGERERDRERPPRQELTMEEKIQRRSMRKATDREANEVLRCHVCGRNIGDVGTIGFDSACPYCSAPLHCCRSCTHFDTSARWQCRGEIREAVADKSKANQCQLYRPRLVLDFTGRRGAPRAQPRSSSDPRAQFESLFKRT